MFFFCKFTNSETCGQFGDNSPYEIIIFRGFGRSEVVRTYQIAYIYIQCEAPKISKLVYNSNNYGLWYL